MKRLFELKPRLRPRRCRRSAAVLLLAIWGTGLSAERRNDLLPKEANASPSVIIPAQQTGFVPPGAILLLQRIAGTTLHFVDSDHLLFTFHKAGLLKRGADAQPDDDDHLIHAELVNISTRQIEAAADWLMHDRDHFLWPLSKGKFLVRQRDWLLHTDASLQLEPYAELPGRLRSVQVSPDSKILVVATEEAPAKRTQPTPASGIPPKSGNPQASDPASEEADVAAPPIVVRVIQLDTKVVLARTRTRGIPRVPAIESGFLEELRGSGDHWVITYKGFDNHLRTIAEVASSCSPTLEFLSSTVVMIGSCQRPSSHLLTAVNLDGKVLWDRRMDMRHIWPALAYSEDGSRFALETIVLNHSISAGSPFDREDVLGQAVEVFDTVGGQSLLTAPASPILDAGQNFALSPDGHRFAVLHNDAIEIYDLK